MVIEVEKRVSCILLRFKMWDFSDGWLRCTFFLVFVQLIPYTLHKFSVMLSQADVLCKVITQKVHSEIALTYTWLQFKHRHLVTTSFTKIISGKFWFWMHLTSKNISRWSYDAFFIHQRSYSYHNLSVIFSISANLPGFFCSFWEHLLLWRGKD